MSPREVTPTSKDTLSNLISLPQALAEVDLIKQNRFLMLTVFILTIAVFIIGFFTLPTGIDLGETLKNKQQTAKEKQFLRETKVNRLQEELVSIVSGSIEGKLTTLEENIKLGSVLSSLQTLEHIRTEVKVLHKYADPLSQKQLQNTQVNIALRQEVSALRTLIYITLGSGSLMFCAFLLIWIKKSKQRNHLYQQDKSYLTNLTK
jgi:hypothetical protein